MIQSGAIDLVSPPTCGFPQDGACLIRWSFFIFLFFFPARFTVRDFQYNEEEMKADKEEMTRLSTDKKKQFVSEVDCETLDFSTYRSTDSCWIVLFFSYLSQIIESSTMQCLNRSPYQCFRVFIHEHDLQVIPYIFWLHYYSRVNKNKIIGCSHKPQDLNSASAQCGEPHTAGYFSIMFCIENRNVCFYLL